MPLTTSPTIKTLTQIGLSEKEATVYESLLNLGKANMSKLLPKVPYKRGNTYDILKDLISKGLVSEAEERGKTLFVVEPPIVLQKYIDQRSAELERQRRTLAANLDQLQSTYHLTISRPVIQYFEGAEGFKSIYEQTLSADIKEIYVFRSIFDTKSMYDFLTKYAERRARAGIKTKIISPTELTDEQTAKDRQLLKERRHIAKDIFNLPTEIDIFQNKVALLSYRDKMIGTIIENRDLADSLRIIFNRLWGKIT